MATLPPDRIAKLLAPYIEASPELVAQLGTYLDLLLRWNARTNLTAIREPEEIVQRHFGESLFAAQALKEHLKPQASLLDYGSGAGFPGLPIQLYLPELRVTLAESQGKKASFLREAVRTLGLKTSVWSERVESMPGSQFFDCVAMRAVDRMDDALTGALIRVVPGGILAVLAGSEVPLPAQIPEPTLLSRLPMPQSSQSWLHLYQNVPRGTLRQEVEGKE